MTLRPPTAPTLDLSADRYAENRIREMQRLIRCAQIALSVAAQRLGHGEAPDVSLGEVADLLRRAALALTGEREGGAAGERHGSG